MKSETIANDHGKTVGTANLVSLVSSQIHKVPELSVDYILPKSWFRGRPRAVLPTSLRRR